MITKPGRNFSRKQRHARVRKKLTGTQDRPRLSVFRSNKHMYAQLIDDVNGFTLVSASTKDKELDVKQTSNVEAASKVGKLLAQRAKEKGLTSVVFDRAGYLYHGRVKALAEATREEGLEF